MALNFQTPISTPEGIIVDNAYGRVAVVNGYAGNVVEAGLAIYASKAAFEAGARPFQPVDMVLGAHTEYDYATDDKNILDLAHDMLIQSLADQGFTATKNL